MVCLISVSALLVAACSTGAEAFVVKPPANQISVDSPTSLFAVTKSDAEALLKKARELKAAAAEAEKSLHDVLLEKQALSHANTDAVIDHLFPDSGSSADQDMSGLVSRVKSKRPSCELLIKVVKRLHEREVEAKGLAHVEPSVHHDHTDFHVVKSKVNTKELERVSGLIDQLISAAEVLDEEYLKNKQTKGDKTSHHSEIIHWAAGDMAKTLSEKAKELRREHDGQFKKRQQEFYDAARKKDKQGYYEEEF